VGNYDSPAGPEQINVSLTLKGGMIQDATYQGTAQFGRSQQYQDAFGQGYRDQVIGKPIDQLSLNVVNGASLTTGGFLNAVDQIKTQAKKA
jgi:major membrane immunogen (membrane-anchored lipoprotein)